MALFLSTTINKIDGKGRVSVPSAFRSALGTGGSFVLFPSYTDIAIEGFSISKMEDLSNRLDSFDLFSENQNDLATTIFAESIALTPDADGRVTLPQHLIQHAELSEHAAFVGLGSKFQIWSPPLLEERKKKAQDNVRTGELVLPPTKKGDSA